MVRPLPSRSLRVHVLEGLRPVLARGRGHPGHPWRGAARGADIVLPLGRPERGSRGLRLPHLLGPFSVWPEDLELRGDLQCFRRGGHGAVHHRLHARHGRWPARRAEALHQRSDRPLGAAVRAARGAPHLQVPDQGRPAAPALRPRVRAARRRGRAARGLDAGRPPVQPQGGRRAFRQLQDRASGRAAPQRGPDSFIIGPAGAHDIDRRSVPRVEITRGHLRHD
mmetsp:Transcript_29593/g.84530  ORF Transcript_29593/g.84530 Transcript_29593/m.84530 type:complete len:224 (+) Transcript_29593:1203-1874(+)